MTNRFWAVLIIFCTALVLMVTFSIYVFLKLNNSDHSISPLSINNQATLTPGLTPSVLAFSHVFLIVMENKNYQQIIDNTKAPFINKLANTYALATNYFAISHPSLPNYLALTAGDTFDIKKDCNDCFLNAPNVFQQLEQSDKHWKAYLENMPSNCSLSDSGLYPLHHNPAAYYLPIRNSCKKYDLPFTEFSKDLDSGNIANFNFISPNNYNNMHSADVSVGDNWVQKTVLQITSSNTFKKNDVIFIVWDEADDNSGDNKVPLIIISPLGKPHFSSASRYNHYSLLRTIEEGLGLPLLGNANNAEDLKEFFK